MTKCPQILVVLSKVLPANAPFAIVTVVGSLINTVHTDVLSINTGNSADVAEIGVVCFLFVAFMSCRNATPLVCQLEVEKGQGTVSFTFPVAFEDDRFSVFCPLPYGM